jgi:non-ribosomal peptide synthetase component F
LAYVPIDPDLTATQKHNITQSLGLSIVVLQLDLYNNASDDWVTSLKQTCQAIILLDNTGSIASIEVSTKTPSNATGKQIWKSELAYVMFTSGTTGQPKAVYVPHKCVVSNVLSITETFQVSQNDVVLLSSPFGFDPSIVQIFGTFFRGASLLIGKLVTIRSNNK